MFSEISPQNTFNNFHLKLFIFKCFYLNKTNNLNIYIFLFSSGYTALHVAVLNNRRDISVMLVAAGANLTIRDNDGNTPMMIAFNTNAKDLAAYLESKANVNLFRKIHKNLTFSFLKLCSTFQKSNRSRTIFENGFGR